MDLGLSGKVAIVTGGTRGIGKAVAQVLAQEGAAVAIVSRNRAEAEQEAASLAALYSVEAMGVAADTGQDGAVAAMVAAVAERFGGVQVLVNCAAQPAGQAAVPPAHLATAEALAEQMNVKVMGYLRCVREVLPHMRHAGWGRIVNISGLGARRTGDVVGSIRNVALVALTKNLADELAGTGITVNVVHPGLTRTEKVSARITARATQEARSEHDVEADLARSTLLGRLPTAAEVADVVAFLASPRSITMNGDVVVAAGGSRQVIYY